MKNIFKSLSRYKPLFLLSKEAQKQIRFQKKMDAKVILQGVIRGWSGSDTMIPTLNQLDAWKDADPALLSAEELERLAGQFFSGSTAIPIDRSKAYELWSIAAEKGSWKAAFSMAGCKLTGGGTARDPVGAYQIYESIANAQKSDFAHVM